MSKILVFTGPKDGRDDEYNEWYDHEHLQNVLAIPGVSAVTRYRLRPLPNAAEEPNKYLAIYEVDCDVDDVLKEIFTRSGDGRMPVSDALAPTSKMLIWEPI